MHSAFSDKVDSLMETIYSIMETDEKVTARIEALEKQNKELRMLLAEKNDKENLLRRMLAGKKLKRKNKKKDI